MNLKQIPCDHDCIVGMLLSYWNICQMADWESAMTCHREEDCQNKQKQHTGNFQWKRICTVVINVGIKTVLSKFEAIRHTFTVIKEVYVQVFKAWIYNVSQQVDGIYTVFSCKLHVVSPVWNSTKLYFHNFITFAIYCIVWFG